MDEVNALILQVVRGVAREKNPELAEVRPDQLLVEDLGLRSLDLARIVAKLELKLDVDPFAQLVPITSVRTAGDLCAAYGKCFDEAEEAEAQTAVDEVEPESSGRTRAAGLDAQRELRKRAREGGAS